MNTFAVISLEEFTPRSGGNLSDPPAALQKGTIQQQKQMIMGRLASPLFSRPHVFAIRAVISEMGLKATHELRNEGIVPVAYKALWKPDIQTHDKHLTVSVDSGMETIQYSLPDIISLFEHSYLYDFDFTHRNLP